MTTTIEDYSWLGPLYLGNPSSYTWRDDEIKVPFEVRSPSDWAVSTIIVDKKVSHKFEGCFIPFYSYIFDKLGVQLPLNTFEKDIIFAFLNRNYIHALGALWEPFNIGTNIKEVRISLNLFFQFFEVNPPSKSPGCGLVSLFRLKKWDLLCLYWQLFGRLPQITT